MVLNSWETRSLDLGLIRETTEVTSRDLLRVIGDRKIWSWEEQEEKEAQGLLSWEQRSFWDLEVKNALEREERGFLKDNLKKLSINDVVVSE